MIYIPPPGRSPSRDLLLGHETAMAGRRFRYPLGMWQSVSIQGWRAGRCVCVFAAGVCRLATGDQLGAPGIDPDELYSLPLVFRSVSCTCSRATSAPASSAVGRRLHRLDGLSLASPRLSAAAALDLLRPALPLPALCARPDALCPACPVCRCMAWLRPEVLTSCALLSAVQQQQQQSATQQPWHSWTSRC